MRVDPQNGYWLLPSRRRPHNLDRFFKAVMKHNTTTKGLVLIQKDEFKELEIEYELLNRPRGWQYVTTDKESQGDKLAQIRDMYMDCDWVGLIGDDQIIETDEWDVKILEWLKGWNFVTCYDDGWQINEKGPNDILQTPGRFCGAPCWSGELLRTVGYIFPPGMHHIHLDDAWEQLALATGCWSFAEHSRSDVIIAHPHYQRGTAEHDETYHRAYEHWGSIDRPAWEHWQRGEFPHVVQRVKELMANFK